MQRNRPCWTLSNIAAGTPTQVASLLSRPSIVKTVMGLLGTDTFEVQKEAVWVLSNLCTGGSAQHIDTVVKLGGIEALVGVLDMNGANDVKVINVALEALKAILTSSQVTGKGYEKVVEDMEGLDRLEALQDHENEEVYNKVVHIITTFFDGEGEDENENENVAPDGQSFSFGVSQSKKASANDFGFGGCAQNTADNNDFGFGFGGSTAANSDFGLAF